MALFSRSSEKTKPENGNGNGAASAIDRLKESPVFKQIPTSTASAVPALRTR